MAILVNSQYVTLLHYADISRYVHMAGDDRLVMNKLDNRKIDFDGDGTLNEDEFVQVCEINLVQFVQVKVNFFCIVNIFVNIFTGSWS